ncbi:unnamed protein product [Blepharisma stoltei]|uniref:C2H2-type domain-containing protein n=1 Tax=Blepharisma stoltei TaxID=1481888 RepID=A0AAU9JLW0_9CILI|nr:unnamed protein product [Blepharisma stoltei]
MKPKAKLCPFLFLRALYGFFKEISILFIIEICFGFPIDIFFQWRSAIEIIMESQRFICRVAGCNKDYCNQFNLKRHYESQHMGVKRFRCKICKKYLSSKQNLKEHRFMHTGAKPYACPYEGCMECFRQGSQLSLHKKVHEEVIKRVRGIPQVETSLNLLTSVLTKTENEDKIECMAKLEEQNIVLPSISSPQVGIILPSTISSLVIVS